MESLPELPEDIERWTLQKQAAYEFEQQEEENGEAGPLDTMSHNDAMEGFDRLKKREKKSFQSAKTAPPSQSQQPMSEESTKYQEESALSHKLLVEKLLKDENTPTPKLNLPQTTTPQVTLRNDSEWDPNLANDKLPDLLKQYEEVFTAPSHGLNPLAELASGSRTHSRVISHLNPEQMTPIGDSSAPRSPKQVEFLDDFRVPRATTPFKKNEDPIFSFLESRGLMEVIDGVEIQNIVDMELEASIPTLTDQKLSERNEMFLGSFASNQTSGRIGERIAVSLLSPKYLIPYGGVEVIDVIWLNEEKEEYQPYDLVVTYADGKQRYCEVKTRMWSEEDGVYVPQWFISPNEIEAASKYQERYFCILIALKKQSYHLKDVQFLGYEAGLVHAMKSQQAHLVLQLSSPTSHLS